MDNNDNNINQPQYNQTYGVNPSAQTGQMSPGSGPLKNKKMVIALAGGGVLILAIFLIIAVAAGGDNKPAQVTDGQTNTGQNSLLESAKAIDIEYINNSISQDVSSLNDDSQLPANRLDDKTLGL